MPFLTHDTRWFRCRRCGYMKTGSYHGQWQTTFPPCADCGLERGEVDAVDTEVEIDWDGRLQLPMYDAPYLTSRFGKGTEYMEFEDPKHRWSLSRDGPIYDAVFCCRRCGQKKRGTYKEQWNTDFPLCDGPRCEDGGRVDCLEWHGYRLNGPPRQDCLFLSSRFGIGTEVLPLSRVGQIRHRQRSRSRSPKREQSPYRSRRDDHDGRYHVGRDASYNHHYGFDDGRDRLESEDPYHHQYGVYDNDREMRTREASQHHHDGVNDDQPRLMQRDTEYPHGYGGFGHQMDHEGHLRSSAFDQFDARNLSPAQPVPRYHSQRGYRARYRARHTPSKRSTGNSGSKVVSRPQVDSSIPPSRRRARASNPNLLPIPSQSVNAHSFPNLEQGVSTQLPSHPPAKRQHAIASP